MKKLTLSVLSVFLFVAETMAQDPAGKIDAFYSTWLKPLCLSIAIIVIIVGGVANLGDIRAGGESAKKAYLSWGAMILFAVVIFAIPSILKAILA
jgi:hypothetical protein